MEKQTLDKYSFKKYLLTELHDTRQDELIFWKNTIPMPIDLIYGIFDRRGELLRKYLDHIAAACLYGYALREEEDNWQEQLETQPNKANRANTITLSELFNKYRDSSRINIMLEEIADLLLLDGYKNDTGNLVEALCHEGRKYKRLYLPPKIRAIINQYFPYILDHIGKSNWDMFSNVVADELRIYRMGFADAFSGIFNKLIDFQLSFASNKKGHATISNIKITSSPNPPNRVDVSYGFVSDGSIWEPQYDNGSTTFVLNKQHTFCDYVGGLGTSAEQVLVLLAGAFAEAENETMRDTERRVIEILRQDISRKLRLKMEDMHNFTE